MHRFFVPPELCRSDLVTLTGGEAHHALRVLRLRAGDPVTILDGAGAVLEGVIADAARDSVRVSVKSRQLVPKSSYEITLLQALPKGKLINSIVEKATELGAARVIPLLTERVVTHLDGGKALERREHWQQAAIEALKQCGCPWLPQIESATTPAEFIARGMKFDLPLIASLQPGSRHPREWFAEYRARENREPVTLCCWVGPEGDFTPEEMAAITAGGALPMTLGPNVLRSDTAAVYCLSVLSYELQAKPRG